MNKLPIFVIIFSVLSTESIASSCDGILRHGLRNIQISKGTESSIATKYFNHCHKDFSELADKTMGTIEVEVFGYGGGGGTYSRDKRTERMLDWCKTNKEMAQNNSSSYHESQIIYSDAVAAWDNCNKLSSDKVQITSYISPDAKDVDITLRYTGPTTSGVKFFGTRQKGFTCETVLPNGHNLEIDQLAPPEITPEAISISCTRDSEVKETINSQEYSVLPRGVITVKTASHPLQLFFPKEYTPNLPDQRAVILENKFNSLKKQMESLSAGLKNSVVPFNSENCPSGWKEYTPAYGRFIRGLDKSNEIDLNRKLSSLQEDVIKSHFHEMGVNGADTTAMVPGGAAQRLAHFNSDVYGGGGRKRTHSVGEKETRPKNVALLFCIKE